MSRYQDLEAWRRAMDLAAGIQEITRSFPEDERYGLVAQLRRAAVSIPSNIAEGYGRWSPRDTRQFLYRARGSLYEVETQLRLSQRFGYIPIAKRDDLLQSVNILAACIQGLIRHLNSRVEV